MTTADPGKPLAVAAEEVDDPLTQMPTWERWLERSSERLNPILIKEARQALKSKQFVITFLLLLAFGWIWTMFAVARQAASIYFAEGGLDVLSGYFVILSVPALVIVPFSAFRAIAGEKEHGTYELLSISTLPAYQIVTGKMAVAVMQLMIYYSALAPFVVFTYILRGVDILLILFVLSFTFLMSLLFSAVGLLAGTVAKAAHWQVFLSVVFLAFLGFATFGWSMSMLEGLMRDPSSIDSEEFWWGFGSAGIVMLTYVGVCCTAASSQVSFASDNQSTRTRIALMVQQAVWIAVMLCNWLKFAEDEFLYMIAVMPAVNWAICGAFMTGELGELSPRVKRTLPQSAVGRIFLTWLYPGSGAGYVFTVANMATLSTLVIVAVQQAKQLGFRGAPNTRDDPVSAAIFLVGYLALYLGLGRVIILIARRYLQFGVVISFFIQISLAFAGCIVPLVVQMMFQRVFGTDYTTLQAPNWMWTLAEVMDGRARAVIELQSSLMFVSIAAVIVFLLNLALAIREVEQERQVAPQRVLEEERSGQAKPAVNPLD